MEYRSQPHPAGVPGSVRGHRSGPKNGVVKERCGVQHAAAHQERGFARIWDKAKATGPIQTLIQSNKCIATSSFLGLIASSSFVSIPHYHVILSRAAVLGRIVTRHTWFFGSWSPRGTPPLLVDLKKMLPKGSS